MSFSETVGIETASNFARELIKIFDEDVSVQWFRKRLRGLVRMVNDTLEISDSIEKVVYSFEDLFTHRSIEFTPSIFSISFFTA